LIKEYAACFGAAPVQIFANAPPARSVAPHPFQHCLFGMTPGVSRLSGVITASYDKHRHLVTAINHRGEFIRFPIEQGETFQGRLSLPLPSELEDRAREHLKIALVGNTAVISLPWDSAFYIFKLASGVTSPTIVNRIHRERITAITSTGSLFATAAKDCSLRIWRLNENSLLPVAFAIKHRTPVKLMRINEKLQMCVSVSFDGFVLALSTINGRFLHAFELRENDPSLLAFTDFGCVVVGFNQGNACLIKILDQNLKPVAERRVSSPISCWRYVLWGDGAEYLIAWLAENQLVLFKLPFFEKLGVDFRAEFAVANLDFVVKPLSVLLTDTQGRLFCARGETQKKS
jgi:hypothetical protein